MQTTTNNVDIAKHCYDLFAKGDIETMTRDFFAPGITWTEPEVEGIPGGGTHRGAQEIVKNVFGTVEQTFGKDFQIHPGTWYSDGEAVILEGRFSGNLNGTDYELPFCHVMKIKDGKLAAFRDYTDTWALKELHA